METKAVVFDYDDTLTDGTEAMKQETFWRIFEDLGSDAANSAEAFVRPHAGTPRKQMIEGILTTLADGGFRFAPNATEQYLERYGRTTSERSIAAPAMRGAVEALTELCQYGILLFVNSATPQADIEKIIKGRGWQEYFAGVYGSPPGTKTGHLNEIISANGFSPADVVVIGDGKSDLEAARAVGCRFIGILGAFSPFSGDTGFPVLADLEGLKYIIK